MVELLIAVIIAALIFDYINGFHDAANAIATSVATGVLPLRTAVMLAAFFNFAGAMAGTAVAKTIATGFCAPEVATQTVVLAALLGASVWNLLTWWLGIPSSSSHALIGGLCGAVVGSAGMGAFRWATLLEKVVKPLVVSPLLGFTLALALMIALLWLVRRLRPGVVNRNARRAQLLSACAMGFSHGQADAQKVMGIIALALFSYQTSGGDGLPHWMLPAERGHVPFWVVIACAGAIALGTAAGGKRIIKTMGSKVIRISPLQGFAAETAGASILFGFAHLGVPVSTTHCINACIMGVGASKRISAVRWIVAWKILIAWIVTLPCSAAFAWLFLKLLRLMPGF
jgi:PiT family inorganic phosphate transporter